MGRGEIAAHIEVLCSVAKVPVVSGYPSIGICARARVEAVHISVKQDRGESGNGRPVGYGFSGIPVRYDGVGQCLRRAIEEPYVASV